jgi:hypothetical protein
VALIKRLAMRRKIQGVSEEELAANPLFTWRPQAPLQEQPPPPPPPARFLDRRPPATPDVLKLVEETLTKLEEVPSRKRPLQDDLA